MSHSLAHTLVLIGAGGVATQLGIALQQKGFCIRQVYSRTETAARSLGEKLGVPFTTSLQAHPQADIYLVAVSDDALPEVIPAVTAGQADALYIHTAGSVPMEVWKGYAARCGVLYPLQSLSKSITPDFSTLPFFIEANNPADAELLKELAATLSTHVYTATSEQRKWIHLSAVFACNFTNHLYAVAAKLMQEHGLPFEALLPLIDETARKVHTLPPVVSQTGPAAREDRQVMQKQIQLLASDKELAGLYERLSAHIIEYAHLYNNQTTKQ